MRVKIIPHGVLRQTWPLGYECEAASPSEAMTALTTTHKLPRPLGNKFWQVRLVGYDTVPAINSPLRTHELHVVPDFSGGNGGLKIVIGAVIVVAAAAVVYFSGGTLSPLATAMVASAFATGASLVLGGVLELMTPAPPTNTPNATSNYLGTPQNTVAGNTPIPIGFGRYLVHGQFLSFNIQSSSGAGGSALRANMGFASLLGTAINAVV